MSYAKKVKKQPPGPLLQLPVVNTADLLKLDFVRA